MASSPKGDSRVYVFDEIKKHNQTKDCWVIIHGKVYDLTSWMDDHPGGPEVLLAATGKDGTRDFEDTGHSDYAEGLMHQFCIGEVDMSTVPLKPTRSYASKNENKSSDFLVKIMQLITPLLILALALAVRNYVKEK